MSAIPSVSAVSKAEGFLQTLGECNIDSMFSLMCMVDNVEKSAAIVDASLLLASSPEAARATEGPLKQLSETIAAVEQTLQQHAVPLLEEIAGCLSPVKSVKEAGTRLAENQNFFKALWKIFRAYKASVLSVSLMNNNYSTVYI